MHSSLPKVLHPLAGKPMIQYGIDLALRVSPEPPVLILGHEAERVWAAVGADVRVAIQAEQLGTAHAVMQAQSLLQNSADLVLAYAGDMPLLTPESLRAVVALHGAHDGPMTMLTAVVNDPRGFGRIIRGQEGDVVAIVEEVEATEEQRSIRELNPGVYCFDADWLWDALARIQPSAVKGEYYLTDTVALSVADGHPVKAIVADDAEEVMGINTRLHLAEAEAILRTRINHSLMLSGVTLIDPAATYVMSGVSVGEDTTIWPGVCLLGSTTVGRGCEIGPHAVLIDYQLEDGASVPAGARLTPAGM